MLRASPHFVGRGDWELQARVVSKSWDCRDQNQKAAGISARRFDLDRFQRRR